jgi:hypothetical protein
MARIRVEKLKQLACKKDGPEAVSLYMQLQACHGAQPGKTFALSHSGMQSAGLIAFGRDKFLRVVRLLMETGLVGKSGSYKPNHFSQQFKLLG